MRVGGAVQLFRICPLQLYLMMTIAEGNIQVYYIVWTSSCTFQIPWIFVKLRQGSGKDRQGSARDGSQGKRPQSFNPCLELTLKLVNYHNLYGL